MKRCIKWLLMLFMVGISFWSGRIMDTWDEKKGEVEKKESEVPISDFSALQALGYIEETDDSDTSTLGVLKHDPAKAWSGLNFFHSGKEKKAYLMDMQGHIIHTWKGKDKKWSHVTLMPNGDIVVVQSGKCITKLNLNSEIIWEYKAPVHHDIWIDNQQPLYPGLPESTSNKGQVYAIQKVMTLLPSLDQKLKTKIDEILILNADGKLLKTVSILDIIKRSEYSNLLPVWSKPQINFKELRIDIDMLHTNHIEVFDGHLSHKSPLFKKGNLLISIRNMNSIAIIEPGTWRIVWLWGPSNLYLQHHPTLLRNGHILLFNNGTKRSKIFEIDPLTLQLEWSYDPKEEDFFSRTRGSVQRLGNGNTLITESDDGYVREVTPDGEIVWSFSNIHFSKKGRRRPLWRMLRFQESEIRFLNSATK